MAIKIILALAVVPGVDASTPLHSNTSTDAGQNVSAKNVPVFQCVVPDLAIWSGHHHYLWHIVSIAAKVGVESGLFEDLVPNWRDFRVKLDTMEMGPDNSTILPTPENHLKSVPKLLKSHILGEQPMTAFLSYFNDDDNEVFAPAVSAFGLVFVTGNSAGRSTFSDKRFFPFYIRTTPLSTERLKVWAQACVSLGWNRATIVMRSSQQQDLADEFTSHFHKIAPESQVFSTSMEVYEGDDVESLAQWNQAEVIAITRAILQPNSRIILCIMGSSSAQKRLQLLLPYLIEVGLLGPEYVWMMDDAFDVHFTSEIVENNIPPLFEKLHSAAPANPMWQAKHNWTHISGQTLGFLLGPRIDARGTRFYSEGWRQLWSSITQDQLRQAGAKHILDDTHYDPNHPKLRHQSFRKHMMYMTNEKIWMYYLTCFDAVLSLYVAIGQLLAVGTEPMKIQGQVLYDAIRNSPFEGISGPVNLTSGDRPMMYKLYQMQPKWNEIYASPYSAVEVGMYDALDGFFVLTGALRFASGTETPPQDRRAPCAAGTQYDKSVSQCAACVSGRYSPELGSKCFTCPPGRYSPEPRVKCVQCSFGSVEPEDRNGPCIIDLKLILSILCAVVIGCISLFIYTSREKWLHMIHFRRVRKQLPQLVGHGFVHEFELDDMVQDEKTFVPPQDHPKSQVLKEILEVYQDQLKFKGLWNPAESNEVMQVFNVLLKYFKAYIDAIEKREGKMQPLMHHSYESKRRKYLGVYNSVLRGVIMVDELWLSYPPLIKEVQALVMESEQVAGDAVGKGSDTTTYAYKRLMAHRGYQPSLNEDAKSLVDLMQHSLGSQAWLAKVCLAIARASGATVGHAKQKSTYRVIEKFALERRGHAAPVHRCRDAAREMIICKDVATIVSVLREFKDRMVSQEILIVSFKDRFQQPTDGGWADCLLCVVKLDDKVFHVAEVQIVHEDMMAVRRNMGAHHEYNEFRAIAEIFAGLKWALSSTASADTATITQQPTDHETLVQSLQETVAKLSHQLEDQAKQLAKYRQHEPNAIAIQELDEVDDHHDESASLASPPKPKVQEKIAYQTQIAIEP